MRAQSSGQTKKLLVLIFLLWVIANHCVRIFSGPAAQGSAANPTGAFPTSGSQAFASANNFRIALGKRVKNVDSYCPQPIGGFCGMTMEGVVMILGLS